MKSFLKKFLFLGFLLPLSAEAENERIVIDFDGKPLKDGVPDGWQLKEKEGKAQFEIVEANGKKVLWLKSKNTSFSLNRKISVDLKKYPYIQWRWKVVRLPREGDFRKSKTDDQAAQILLAFSRTEILVYLWDSTAPEGFMGEVPSPFFMDIYAVAVRAGSKMLGKWLTEARNAYEDYKKLFKKEPPVLGGIRVQINSQHTESSA